MNSPSDEQSGSLVTEPGERIADLVFARLRRAIVRHEMPPDFHLSVPQLAAKLGTSRSPVHEAVKRLVQEGLAVEFPRRGAFVVSFNSRDLLPLYEMRSALDGLAARLAAERASQEDIRRLRSALERQAAAVQADDVELHVETDMEFHRLLIEMSGNQFLKDAMTGIYARIHGAMSTRAVRTSPARALQDHKAILTAIEARDPSKAAAEATQHVTKSLDRLMGRVSQHDETA